MRKEVGALVDEFSPQGDEKGVGQREPKKQTGAWQWEMHVGNVEDAVWRIIFRNESVDDRFLPCCVDCWVVKDDVWKMAVGT